MKAANRGKQWQNILSAEFGEFGGHTIVKTDPPVRVFKMLGGAKFEGCFAAAGQCDFEGGFRGVHVCLEAKDCHDGAFPKAKIRDGQWKRLEAARETGAISGLLVRFAGPTADLDEMWLVEFGALKAAFGKRASVPRAALTAENAHRLAYRAIRRGEVGLYGLESALIRIETRLRQDALRG